MILDFRLTFLLHSTLGFLTLSQYIKRIDKNISHMEINYRSGKAPNSLKFIILCANI